MLSLIDIFRLMQHQREIISWLLLNARSNVFEWKSVISRAILVKSRDKLSGLVKATLETSSLALKLLPIGKKRNLSSFFYLKYPTIE